MSKCTKCETTGVVGYICDRCRIAELEAQESEGMEATIEQMLGKELSEKWGLDEHGRFIAIERDNEVKALSGGICTATRIVTDQQGRLLSVHAVDSNAQKRVFHKSIWKFQKKQAAFKA